MHLILVGSEYAGTPTLSWEITKWVKDALGDDFSFHDHWKAPYVSHPNSPDGDVKKMWVDWEAGNGPDPTMSGHTDEENQQYIDLSPKIRESFQRYHMEYHVGESFYGDAHHNSIGYHIDEAVYAPLYYGYGGPGEYADRQWYARHIEQDIMHRARDTTIVLVKASADTIRDRRNANPHKFSYLQEEDIEKVLEGFETQYNASFIRNKFEIDTTTATKEENLAEFVEKFEPHLSDTDRAKIMYRRQKKLLSK
jgi:hypothetical protein